MSDGEGPNRPAALALEDGTVFRGRALRRRRRRRGRGGFNTSMTGYQEILTDPSYRGQIVVMTYPQIGNYGVNPEDVESARRSSRASSSRSTARPSNWRARERSATTSRATASPASRASTPARWCATCATTGAQTRRDHHGRPRRRRALVAQGARPPDADRPRPGRAR